MSVVSISGTLYKIGFLFQYNPKDLEPSYKMGAILQDGSRLRLFQKKKRLSYNRTNILLQKLAYE